MFYLANTRLSVELIVFPFVSIKTIGNKEEKFEFITAETNWIGMINNNEMKINMIRIPFEIEVC